MAFVNRIATILPGFGSPVQNDSLMLSAAVVFTLANSPLTTTLSGITPTFSKGYIRVKAYGGASGPPIVTAIQVIVSDGTTFVAVGSYAPAAAAGTLGTGAVTGSPYTNAGVLGTSVGGLDITFPFCVDINCTQVSFITTMTGTTATGKLDLELSATI